MCGEVLSSIHSTDAGRVDTIFLIPGPIGAISLMQDDVPRSTHWSIAPCVNIRDIDVAVEPTGPGALAQETVTSTPVGKVRSIGLMFRLVSGILREDPGQVCESLGGLRKRGVLKVRLLWRWEQCTSPDYTNHVA